MNFAEHRKILADLKRFEAQIPQMVSVMGAIAEKHFVKSFTNQGFTDKTLEPWQRRKREDRRRGQRGILIKSGALRRSLRRKNIGRYAVDIISDLPYAKVHNYGLRAGRGEGFKMPKRQFVGYSYTMNSKIEQRIDRIIKRTWRS